MIALRTLALLAAALLAMTTVATATPPLSMPGATFLGSVPVSQKRLQLADDVPARTLVLEPVTAAERSAAAAAQVSDKRMPLQIGFARAVPADVAAIDLGGLAWRSLGNGGRTARVVVESPDAAALRTELTLSGSADGLTFRFVGSAAGAASFGPFTWAEIERAASWAPVTEGASASIDIEAAAGTAVEGRILMVPRVSHLTLSGPDLAPDRLKRTQDIGRAGACNIDIACIQNPPSDLVSAAASVAQIVFTESGVTYLCTGSLVNSRNASGAVQQVPYFVTAHHCIGSATAAATINFYWFFEAAICSSRAVPAFQTTPGGASLLYTSYDVDVTFLRMNNAPPAGTFLAGWDATPVSPGTSVIALHHPKGDLKKYSVGASVDFAHDFDDLQNTGNYVPQGSYLRVNWSQGTTEEGSSGGGVYTRAGDGQYQLRGVLHGGDASCLTPQGLDYFARFDLAYPSISQYLAGTSQPSAGGNAIEYYNVDLDHYFLTSFADETRFVDSGGAGRGWVRTGYAFGVASAVPPPAGDATVCRFYGNPEINPATGLRKGPNSHFYTADPGECAQVKKDPGWVYEGLAFAIAVPRGGACPANTVPVFRLYNNGFATNDSNHRYTTSPGIYQFMLTQKWSGEQTVMCAPAAAG